MGTRVSMWRAFAVVLAASGALFAGLTLWTDHTTAAGHTQSHVFAQEAKSICDHAPHTATGLAHASRQLCELAEPSNVHRAVARLRLHWGRLVTMLRTGTKTSSKPYRAELKQARLSAHLLNISACRSIAPK
jgi:hypothetical protein